MNPMIHLKINRFPFHYHFDFNFLDLKSQNDGPHETKNEPGIAIDDVFSANTLQAHLNNDEAKINKKKSPPGNFKFSHTKKQNKNKKHELWYGETPSFC